MAGVRDFENRFFFLFPLWEYLENSVTSTHTHTHSNCMIKLYICFCYEVVVLYILVFFFIIISKCPLTMSCDSGWKLLHNNMHTSTFLVFMSGSLVIIRVCSLYVLQPYINSLIVQYISNMKCLQYFRFTPFLSLSLSFQNTFTNIMQILPVYLILKPQ